MTNEEQLIAEEQRARDVAPKMLKALKAVFRDPQCGSLGTATQKSVIAAILAAEGLSG